LQFRARPILGAVDVIRFCFSFASYKQTVAEIFWKIHFIGLLPKKMMEVLQNPSVIEMFPLLAF
jgi:hypothetical protein